MAKAATPDAPAPAEGEQQLTLPDIVTALVKQAKGKGAVTYDQLNAILPDATNDPEQLDQILEQLEAKGVELVEEFDDPTATAEGTEEGAQKQPPLSLKTRPPVTSTKVPTRSPVRPRSTRRSTTRSACICRRWVKSRC